MKTITDFERQKSENWWKGIVVGFLLFFGSLGMIAVIPGTGIPASTARYLVVLVFGAAWGLLSLSIFLDAKYVTEYSNWEPSIGLYLAIVLLFPIVAPLAGAVYLFKRHRSLGVP